MGLSGHVCKFGVYYEKVPSNLGGYVYNELLFVRVSGVALSRKKFGRLWCSQRFKFVVSNPSPSAMRRTIADVTEISYFQVYRLNLLEYDSNFKCDWYFVLSALRVVVLWTQHRYVCCHHYTRCLCVSNTDVISKGKGHPKTGRTGPEGK